MNMSEGGWIEIFNYGLYNNGSYVDWLINVDYSFHLQQFYFGICKSSITCFIMKCVGKLSVIKFRECASSKWFSVL